MRAARRVVVVGRRRVAAQGGVARPASRTLVRCARRCAGVSDAHDIIFTEDDGMQEDGDFEVPRSVKYPKGGKKAAMAAAAAARRDADNGDSYAPSPSACE